MWMVRPSFFHTDCGLTIAINIFCYFQQSTCQLLIRPRHLLTCDEVFLVLSLFQRMNTQLSCFLTFGESKYTINLSFSGWRKNKEKVFRRIDFLLKLVPAFSHTRLLNPKGKKTLGKHIGCINSQYYEYVISKFVLNVLLNYILTLYKLFYVYDASKNNVFKY